MQKFCVVTIDLVSSRNLKERNLVQEELKGVIRIINQKYNNSLKVPFAITLGDEIQGVLVNLWESYLLIRDFRLLLKEHPFYAGVGYGEITTRLSKRSGEMDGPAFHLARASIDYLKDKYSRIRSNINKRKFSPLIYYSFTSSELTTIVNNYLLLIELLKFNLTEKQKEVYWLLFKTDTYREIAELLSQSRSAITQKIQSGFLGEIKSGEEGFICLLKNIEGYFS